MPWSWVRPADPTLLDLRPLLDLGTGDGQTLAALVRDRGLVVGVDRSASALPAARRAFAARFAAASADRLPFLDGTFRVLLAADLFHHLDDETLVSTLTEVRRVLRPGGCLVAWWYEQPSRPGPDAPRFPRTGYEVARMANDNGLAPRELALEFRLEPAPATAGLVATR